MLQPRQSYLKIPFISVRTHSIDRTLVFAEVDVVVLISHEGRRHHLVRVILVLADALLSLHQLWFEVRFVVRDNNCLLALTLTLALSWLVRTVHVLGYHLPMDDLLDWDVGILVFDFGVLLLLVELCPLCNLV